MTSEGKLYEACKAWVEKGRVADGDDIDEILAGVSYDKCAALVESQNPGAATQPSAPVHTISSVAAAAPSRIHIPNLFKSEFFIVASLSILLPLLVIGFYTGWKYRWPENKKKPPP